MKPTKVQLCFLWTFLFIPFLAAEGIGKELSTAQAIALVHPIESLAIQYGTGNVKAYIFVDPKCPHSRDFLSMIYDSDKMRSIYHYYIFFFELKRLHSHDLIGTIYASSTPLQQTLGVMVGKKKIKELKSFPTNVNERIEAIAAVAEAIGVNKRPYLILNKELD